VGARMNGAVELALRRLPVQDGPRVEAPGKPALVRPAGIYRSRRTFAKLYLAERITFAHRRESNR